jgi:hypothetical protein
MTKNSNKNSLVSRSGRPLLSLFLFFIGGIPLSCGIQQADSIVKIIGGDVPGPGHVSLGNTVGLSTSNSPDSREGLPSCSGFVVERLWIVTAAHCAANGTLKFVYFKSEDPTEKPQWRDVEKVILHPDWKGEGLFDLALIRYKALPEDGLGLPLNYKPVDIVNEEEAVFLRAGGLMDIAGYGVAKIPSEAPPTKLHALVTIDRIWNDFFMAPGLITYSDPKLRGACYGDSGGPAYAELEGKTRVIGITQGARGRYFNRMEKVECQEGKGTYTYLMPFRDWILKSTKGQLTSSFPWEDRDPDFSSLTEFCNAPKNRDVWLAFYSLAGNLEESTRIPMYGCSEFSKASATIVKLELEPWSKYAQVQPLLGSLSNLEELWIQDGNGGFSSDVDVSSFQNLKRLKKLVIDGPSLAHMDSLGRLKSLQYLDIFGTSEVSIDTVLQLSNLVTLNLAGDAASEFASLGKLPDLQRLGVRRCILGNEAIEALFQPETFPSLKYGDFSRCAVNYEALAKNEDKLNKFKPGTKFKFQKSLVKENIALQRRISKNAAGVTIVFE